MGPIFVYIYLELIKRDMQEFAQSFYDEYCVYH